MIDPTNSPTPVVPDWAERAMAALADANTAGGVSDRFTFAERQLVSAAWILLRARFGRTHIDNPHGCVVFLLSEALTALKNEQETRS